MITMEELKSNMCKWPIGDPRNKETFHFCGETHDEGCSYCTKHNEMSQRGYNTAQTQEKTKETTKKAA